MVQKFPKFFSAKNALLFIFCLKSLNSTKVFFLLSISSIVAKFGRKSFDILWMFTGGTWLSKMERGATSIVVETDHGVVLGVLAVSVLFELSTVVFFLACWKAPPHACMEIKSENL